MAAKHAAILAIDQGTTSTRAILFDRNGWPLATAQRELGQIYPCPGWVEHDPEEIWQATIAVCRDAIAQAGVPVEAIGIANQRETAILWERDSGRPIHNAIVWQDRRTAGHCDRLIGDGHAERVRGSTGLVIDSYFSATKIAWLLDNIPGARAAAVGGRLAFGTVDSFLLWRLTGGCRHSTDATNAARTLLFDIHRQDWDDDLLALFGVPRPVLPEVLDSSADFGASEPGLFGTTIPVTGIAGDQHAALVGQACFAPGMVKSTYGTGCFALIHTGGHAMASANRLLTTIAYRRGGETAYAIEGSIFTAGAAVQWLRDGLGVIDAASEANTLPRHADPAQEVYMVPAFTGLGAPYWDSGARGALLGLTRDTGVAEIVRAALDAVAFQTRDLLAAMTADGAPPPASLRIDGGMTGNDWLAQRLADLLGIPVERPAVTETTALGAAYLAGLHTGYFASPEAIAAGWRSDRTFVAAMPAEERDRRYQGWLEAVARVRTR